VNSSANKDVGQCGLGSLVDIITNSNVSAVSVTYYVSSVNETLSFKKCTMTANEVQKFEVLIAPHPSKRVNCASACFFYILSYDNSPLRQQTNAAHRLFQFFHDITDKSSKSI